METVVTPTPEAIEAPASLIGAASEAAPEVLALTAEDISIPEGMTIPDEIRDEFLGIVNDPEMNAKDRAQALIDLQAKAAEEASEAASLQFQEQQRQWQDEVKNDPELGGAKFQATLAGISRLVDQYGNDEFVSAMAAKLSRHGCTVGQMTPPLASPPTTACRRSISLVTLISPTRA